MAEKKTIIGLEAHVQLNTASKMFCSCGTEASEPNTQTCEICLGMPGSKPVANKKAIEYGLKLALALNCEINREFFFSRKTYFYPDMAKNFQITQYEIPVGINGCVELPSGKKIRIRRVHLEEDPAALVHGEGLGSSAYTLVDYNRSGIPLAEIVTEPDMASAEEAREFLNQLITILEYLQIFVLGKNTLKADSNISLEGGERVEVKNVSGFRNVERALSFEIERQRKLVGEGKEIERETRSFDEKSGRTKTLRKKETEEDYGYIFEPDLTRFIVDGRWLEKITKSLPELHTERAKRLQKEFGFDKYTAEVLAGNFELSNLFEIVAKETKPELAASFLTRELLAILNRDNLVLKGLNLDAKEITGLLQLLESGKVTEKTAKEAMITYVHKKITPQEFIKNENLIVDMGGKEIENAVENVLRENMQAAEDYKKGSPKAMNFIVGKVMREVKGKAEPRAVQKIIEEKLKK